MDYQVIILAAGRGSRMGASLPKVMHKICNKPMIAMVIDNALQITDDIILVHSQNLSEYIISYQNTCKFVLQDTPLGTAHAVYAAIDLINDTKISLVLFGDTPFIKPGIMKELITYLQTTGSSVTTLAFKSAEPGCYGRIVSDRFGNFLKIVEYKDASPEEKQITVCNSGIMAFAPGILKKFLPLCLTVPEEISKEFYLTKIIEISKNKGEKASYLLLPDSNAGFGINTPEELVAANKIAILFK